METELRPFPGSGFAVWERQASWTHSLFQFIPICSITLFEKAERDLGVDELNTPWVLVCVGFVCVCVCVILFCFYLKISLKRH